MRGTAVNLGKEGRMRGMVWLLVALAAASGCARNVSDRELQRVARDWSMVIRASQILPVYPLTEDLQPGDIFLVQVTVEDQAKTYRERGFMPLDNLIYRLDPQGYEDFYRYSFEAGGAEHRLPKHWLSPGKPDSWTLAPNASFPTYAFSARRGGGFNVALPVQGIPVGLSLLGGDATQGTITIAEARTYGVDAMSLHDNVRAWSEIPANRAFLQYFGGDPQHTNYVRVVSRVYLTGRINVSLQGSRSSGATLSGGAAKPVDLVVPNAGTDPSKNTLEAYTSNIEKLNAMIALREAIAARGLSCQALPDGMSVRVNDRTVYEPDALVRCGPPLPGDAIEVADPVIVVEVVSPSSRGVDRGVKLARYFSLPSVRHYLIVDTDSHVVIHHRRDENGEIGVRIVPDGLLRLDPPGLAIDVQDIFDGV